MADTNYVIYKIAAVVKNKKLHGKRLCFLLASSIVIDHPTVVSISGDNDHHCYHFCTPDAAITGGIGVMINERLFQEWVIKMINTDKAKIIYKLHISKPHPWIETIIDLTGCAGTLTIPSSTAVTEDAKLH